MEEIAECDGSSTGIYRLFMAGEGFVLSALRKVAGMEDLLWNLGRRHRLRM